MKTIAICNQKGGVGKTSTAINLSAMLGINGFKTLVIDLDPQGNATSGLGIDKPSLEHSVYHALVDAKSTKDIVISTNFENLFILPSNIELTGAEVELVNEIGRETKLKKAIASISDEYDYVIVDNPPSLGLLTINGLASAESILIPIQCEFYALEGLSQLIKTIDLVRDNLNENLYIEGILMTMADNRTKLTDQVIQEVRKHFPDKIYNTVIPRNIKMGEAPGFGKPIMFYDKTCSASKKYEEFFKEFINRPSNSFIHNRLEEEFETETEIQPDREPQKEGEVT